MTAKLGGKFIMPARPDGDPEPGMLRVYRLGPDHLVIEPGDGQSIRLSEYAAARVCGTLSLFLNLRFAKGYGDKITL